MEETTIGAVLFDGIEENPYLNELYDAILYNYGRQLFGLTNLPEKEISVPAALRFADILSKSVHTQNEETHKLWAQEIVALLNALHPDDELIQYYLGSVLTSVSNFRGVSLKAADYVSADLLDRIFTQVSKEYLRIPEAENEYFFRAQKEIYEKFNEPYFSYSAPTSLGKSYIMRTFIREQIAKGRQCNFAIIVPTKALINETTEKLTEVLGPELKEKNYRIVTSAGAMALEEEHNFIFAMTPERLLYLLILMKDIRIGGKADYNELRNFLERLCDIFKWETYEYDTLGFQNKSSGAHTKLSHYAFVLNQWVSGMSLNHMVTDSIDYYLSTGKGKVKLKGQYVAFKNEPAYVNALISGMLEDIEDVILFRIANYFLRFSQEYRACFPDASFTDWYELVEYGTTNPEAVWLQRNGFTREAAAYITEKRSQYITFDDNDQLRLKPALLECENLSIRREAEQVQYNSPEIYLES